MKRLEKLRAMLAARTRLNAEGKVEPMPGFAENVAAIKAEIARLEGNLG